MQFHEIREIFTLKQEQIFLGTLLGDGGLRNCGRRRKCNPNYLGNALFTVRHCDKDKEYLFWKYEELKSSCLFGSSPRLSPGRPKTGTTPSWYFYSHANHILTRYHRLFYPHGKKVVPEEVLDRLEPLGLAVWYMDDGSLNHNQYNYPSIRLATHSFTYEENNLIRDWIETKFGIAFKIDLYRGKHWKLRSLGGRQGVKRFLDLVSPYVVPCMTRKVAVLGKVLQ